MARNIHLFLPFEDKKDFRIATMPNWTGSVITASETQVGFLYKRDETQRAGCYMLFSGSRSSGDLRGYIGQTTDFETRLNKHNNDETKSYERVAFISTSDPSFSAGHFLKLEAELIKISDENPDVELLNSQKIIKNDGGLGEAQEADVRAFLQNLRNLLPILGFDVFTVARRNSTSVLEVGAPHNLPDSSPTFVLATKSLNKGKPIAHGRPINDDFLVEKGSLVVREDFFSSQTHYMPLRQTLLNDGVIKPSDLQQVDFPYEFARDYAFNSPSAGAAVIFGRNSNGRTAWKQQDGSTLADWQKRMSNSRAISDVASSDDE